MQTSLPQALLATAAGTQADEILRNCVHCGFCNATCPTYQLTGDELDGPRGRIYQIKQVLEGQAPTARTQLHLDRCLTCRACETTCPSGVDYHLLLDTGRELVEQAVPRSLRARFMRRALRLILPWPARFTPLLRTGQLLRPLLPASLQRQIPVRRKNSRTLPARQHSPFHAAIDRLRTAGTGTTNKHGHHPGTGRTRHSHGNRGRQRLLRRSQSSPRCHGGSKGFHAPEHRCLVAGHRTGGRGDCQLPPVAVRPW